MGIAHRHPRLESALSALLTGKRAIVGPRIPLHSRVDSQSPVFVVGSGRSGTTLVRRLLVASDQLFIPAETVVLGPTIRRIRKLAYLRWPDLVKQTLASFEYHDVFADLEVASLRPLVADMMKVPRNERSLARLLDSMYSFIASQFERTEVRWGDKTPDNVYWLDDLHSVFPSAQFVNVVRDGVDVVSSFLAADLYQDVAAAAHRWVVTTRAAERFELNHPDSVFTIRYERLVTDPESELEAVCRFLGLRYTSAMLDLGDLSHMPDLDRHESLVQVKRPVFADSIGRGRRQLSPSDSDIMRPIIEDRLVELGYAPL